MKNWLEIANEENNKFNNSDFGKLSDGKVKQISIGISNSKSGLLKKIAKKGGKAVGKKAHINLNESQTFESRSRAHKKSFDKSKVEESLKVSPFNKYRAQWLGVTQVTYTKILKEHGLYVKELAHEKFMKYMTPEERSVFLNKHKNK